ncbi:response regulator transcription factor [Streptomyces sp. FXJ1.172]|uniref:response regulator transcription factor n=1 Tax=Streptomyces sp. FXJ1.172 TaxID=710705 RepID=UPI00099F40B3
MVPDRHALSRPAHAHSPPGLTRGSRPAGTRSGPPAGGPDLSHASGTEARPQRHRHRPGLLKRAAEAGVLGFVDKAGSPDRLLRASRSVASRERFVDASLGFGFLKAAQTPLTGRELSVLSLAAGAASIAEIAGSLHLSNGTVRNYMASITRKTGARNRIDAIRISRGEGWV